MREREEGKSEDGKRERRAGEGGMFLAKSKEGEKRNLILKNLAP